MWVDVGGGVGGCGWVWVGVGGCGWVGMGGCGWVWVGVGVCGDTWDTWDTGDTRDTRDTRDTGDTGGPGHPRDTRDTGTQETEVCQVVPEENKHDAPEDKTTRWAPAKSQVDSRRIRFEKKKLVCEADQWSDLCEHS